MTAELAEKLQPCGHPVSQRKPRSDTGFRCHGCKREREKSPEAMEAARAQKHAMYDERRRAELLAGLAALASRAFYSRDTIRRALCGGDLRYTQPTDTLTAADRDDMSRKCRACPVLFGCRLGVERDTDFVGVAADRVWPGNRPLRLPPRSGPEKVRALYAEHDGPWRLSVIELGLRLGTTASTAGKWRQDALRAGLLVEVDPGGAGPCARHACSGPVLSRRARKILADAERVKKAHDEIDNLPLFDMDADVGGRAVDETDTAKARRETRIPGAYICPRCSQMVRPGPHTRPNSALICQEDR